ncbi:MAG: phage baseplate protein [Cetobacterium sp.]|uniref:phage baseplate protein n=1 Tax=Cetobacterium sp. TaxID=2071632 RepID=UPI003EE70DE3
MINEYVKNTLSVLGIELGALYIDDIKVDYRFLTPTDLDSEITDEKIEGDETSDISTHIYNKNVYLTIDGSFSNIRYDHSDKYQKLVDKRNEKKHVKLLGTDFDDRIFAIEKITKKDEGINYLDFEIILKEMVFSQIKTFTYSDSVRSRAEFKPKEKKSKTSAVPWEGA